MNNDFSIGFKAFMNFMIFYISGVMTYLNMDKESILIFTILLTIDYFTGIMKAHRLNKKITSNRMKYGILSKLSLLIIPIVIALGAKVVGIDLRWLICWAINIMSLAEIYSIIANIYTYRTNKELPEIEILSIVAKKIRDTLLKMAGETNVSKN